MSGVFVLTDRGHVPNSYTQIACDGMIHIQVPVPTISGQVIES